MLRRSPKERGIVLIISAFLDRGLTAFAVVLGFKDHCDDQLGPYSKTIEILAGQCAGIRRAGAASLDLAYVAAGRLDAFWEIGLASWDIAAGALLIREAGGLVADIDSSENFLESGNIVAGSPKCFKAVLQTVKPLLR